MERITYRITLDAHKNGIQRTLQGFETADNMARRIAVNLVANGDTYEIQEGNVVALMYVTMPGATEPSINECTIEGNTIVYDVLPITKEGIADMQLKLIKTSVSGAKSVIMSPRFSVEVMESGVRDDNAEQTATFTALENAVARANGVYEARLVRIAVDDDCTFRAVYADGTVYENDALKNALHGGNALLSESWAVGGTGTREGEDTDNSKYYSNVSRSAASEANKAEVDIRGLVDEAQMYSTFTVFDVDYETGELKYLSRNYGFDIDEGTGELMVDGGDAYSPDEIVAAEVNKNIAKSVNYVTPQMFGAVGDGIADDTNAILKCFKYSSIYIPEGKYLIKGTITIQDNKFIELRGDLKFEGVLNAILIHGGNNYNSVFIEGNGSIDAGGADIAIGFGCSRNCHVRGITIKNAVNCINTRYIGNTGGELTFTDITLKNDNVISNSIGINDAGNDNTFINVIVQNFFTCVITSSSKFYNLHGWLSIKDIYKDSVFAIIERDSSCFVNCVVDSIRIGFRSVYSNLYVTITNASYTHNYSLISNDVVVAYPPIFIDNASVNFKAFLSGFSSNVELTLFADVPKKQASHCPIGINSANLSNYPIPAEEYVRQLTKADDFNALDNGCYLVDTYNGNGGSNYPPVSIVGVLSVKVNYIGDTSIILQTMQGYDKDMLLVRTKYGGHGWTGWKKIDLINAG